MKTARPHLISISGSVHAGKTTISRMLPEVHKTIIEFVRRVPSSSLDVIIDYPFTYKAQREIVTALDGINFETKWFLLKPSIDSTNLTLQETLERILKTFSERKNDEVS